MRLPLRSTAHHHVLLTVDVLVHPGGSLSWSPSGTGLLEAGLLTDHSGVELQDPTQTPSQSQATHSQASEQTM